MDGANPQAFPQGVNQGGNDPQSSNQQQAPADAAAQAMNSMGTGMNTNDMAAWLNQSNINTGNQNDAMNAVLMNNALQQQQAAMGMGGGMNPMLLQGMMMNQGGMNPDPFGGMNMMGMGGMSNLNAMGGLGMNDSATAGGMGMNNDVLMQLMQNPMAAQMLAQGMNPMVLLGAMGGMNPLGMGMMGAGLGGGIAASDPNAFFAANNLMAPQAPTVPATATAADDGALRAAGQATKKQGKKKRVAGKPKRPLSAYNFFFREERARILDALPKGDGKKATSDSDNEQEVKREKADVNDKKEEADVKVKKEEADEKDNDSKKEGEKKEQTESKDDDTKKESEKKEEADAAEDSKKDAVDTKPKEEGEKDYDQVDKDGKKIPHGKIGFESLAKRIGRRWKELDEESLAKYKKLADEDMTRYKKEMEVFLSKEALVGGTADGELTAPPSHYGMATQKRKNKAGVDDENDKKKSKAASETGVDAEGKK